LFVEQLEGRRLLASFNWDGAPDAGGASVDAKWRTNTNWRFDVLPVNPVSDIEFPAGAANLSNFNDYSAGSTFNSILMSGSGYTLQGNAITMRNGITSTIPPGSSNNVNLPIALTADQTWTSTTAGSTLDASGGAIDLGGFNLVVSGDGTTILGAITDPTAVGGTNGVRAEGGTVVLSADNTTDSFYAFAQDGTLQILGSAPQTIIDIGGGTLTTDAAATTGPITAIAQNGGSIAPGGVGATGILSTQGNVVMSGQGFTSFAVDLNGATAGSGYDSLHVTGTATLGDAFLNVHTGFGSANGNNYTILTATAGVSGKFNGLNDLDTFTADGRTFQIHYSATSVVLTDVTVEYVVNVNTDEADANTSDGLCDTDLATPGLQCTLRAAILQANASPDSNPIKFNIPGAGVHTISPASELPTITDPVTIDGYTQPGATPNSDASGFNGKLMIELSGASAGNAVGLKIGGDDTTVRGLVINRFMNGFGAIWVLVSDPEAGVSDVHIEGNLIGTNATGTAALGNKVGLTFSDVASGSIGGASPAARNVISGNTGDGIFAFPNIFLPSSTLSIQGNFIGLAVDGTSPLGNGGRGIYLPDGVAPGTTIGGQDAGAGNKIAYNVGTGVVLQSATFGIPILSNAIFGNGTLGIDLNRDGATPNDAGDADTGPNNLQNYPEISHATRDAGQLKVTYNVPSTPANSVYPIRVEFFLADANGQGKTFLGFDTFSNDDFDAGGKTADFTTNSPTKVFDKLVVTATDDSGIRNTSEFSPTVTIVSPWQNHNPGRLRWDVTDDTHVVADDVLTIINYINAKGSGKVPDNAANAKPFLDVDGDNSVVAADVIDVINYINAGKKLGGEAEATWEGEAPAEPVAANSQSPLAIGQSPAAGDLMALIAADVAAQAARKQRI
jgi:hypothetical protein